MTRSDSCNGAFDTPMNDSWPLVVKELPELEEAEKEAQELTNKLKRRIKEVIEARDEPTE